MLGKSKVLDTNSEWYDEIDATSFYEKNFERTFLSKISEVYPDFIGIPFNLTIATEDEETSDPDLAIIKNDYKEWFVIEVEMGRHSWDNHVDKQVRVFTNGIYEKKRIAEYIHKKDSSLDLKKLESMVENYPPKVMIIANEEKKEWKKKAKKYKALISVFQIYKGLNGLELYRIEGHTPYVFRDKSHCSFLKSMSNTLEVYTPTFIEEANDEEVVVIFRGRKTKWKVIRDEERLYLVFIGRTHFLQLENKYLFYKSELNEYYLEYN